MNSCGQWRQWIERPERRKTDLDPYRVQKWRWDRNQPSTCSVVWLAGALFAFAPPDWLLPFRLLIGCLARLARAVSVLAAVAYSSYLRDSPILVWMACAAWLTLSVAAAAFPCSSWRMTRAMNLTRNHFAISFRARARANPCDGFDDDFDYDYQMMRWHSGFDQSSHSGRTLTGRDQPSLFAV